MKHRLLYNQRSRPLVVRRENAACDHMTSTGYLGDDGRAVVLGPEGGGGAPGGSAAASVAPATFGHPRRQQTGSAGGQLTTAGANQRDLGDLRGEGRTQCVSPAARRSPPGAVVWFPGPPCFPSPSARHRPSRRRRAAPRRRRRAPSPGGR